MNNWWDVVVLTRHNDIRYLDVGCVGMDELSAFVVTIDRYEDGFVIGSGGEQATRERIEAVERKGEGGEEIGDDGRR